MEGVATEGGRESQKTVKRMGGFVVVFLPDFSDDIPVVLLVQGPCSWSWGPWLALGVWVHGLRSQPQRKR